MGFGMLRYSCLPWQSWSDPTYRAGWGPVLLAAALLPNSLRTDPTLRYRRWRVTGKVGTSLSWFPGVGGTFDLHTDAASMHVSANDAGGCESARSTSVVEASSTITLCLGWLASHSAPVPSVRFTPEYPMDSIATAAGEATI